MSAMEKKRILLVDDEKDVRELISFRLQSYGYEVICAADGQEALDTARKEKPDVIVLDLMLPRIDGYKVCGLLKQDARYNKIPIIMFSARGQESDMALGEEIGADAYLIKTSGAEVLAAKIGELLKA